MKNKVAQKSYLSALTGSKRLCQALALSDSHCHDTLTISKGSLKAFGVAVLLLDKFQSLQAFISTH